jgi:hypothetical protein
MDAGLEAAFRNTRYRVSTSSGELQLHVDRPDAILARLLRESGAHCAALVTAFNPGGRRMTAFRNRRAQRRLRDELLRGGHRVFEGRNEDPHRRWPVESSMLVINLPLAAARNLCTRYGQVAFLWSGPDGTPRLHATAAV